jgi:hypothetical protein
MGRASRSSNVLQESPALSRSRTVITLSAGITSLSLAPAASAEDDADWFPDLPGRGEVYTGDHSPPIAGLRCWNRSCHAQLGSQAFSGSYTCSPPGVTLTVLRCRGLFPDHRKPLFPIFTRARNYGAYSMRSQPTIILPDTCRTIPLLLYGAGLRISEALAVTIADVDSTPRSSVSATAGSATAGWCRSAMTCSRF